jgi:hypothetical protein
MRRALKSWRVSLLFLVPKLLLGNPFLCQAPPGKEL